VSDNLGPGLWCDIYCRDVVVSGNRIHHNSHAGLFFEVSTGATIADNRIWENGWGKASWGWGAGILVSSSGGAHISDNIVAWNYAGISILSQDRQDWSHSETDNDVHDNVVIAELGRYTVIWAQDWSGPLFASSSSNRGSANRYWVDHPEDGQRRFAWSGDIGRLADYNATPAEEGGTYLTDSEKTTILSDAGMPPGPESGHPGASPLASREAMPIMVAIVAAIAVGLVLTAAVVWWAVRRRGAESTR
jgi:Periplasmic copper-binding protein (NosD)